jgi:hypothetical protein
VAERQREPDKAIHAVRARIRYLTTRIRRGRRQARHARAKIEHFQRVGKEAVKEWERADKQKAPKQRAKRRAKRKAKRAARKRAFWHEALDDIQDGQEKAVARRKRAYKKLALLKKIHAEEKDVSSGGDTGRVMMDGWPMAGWLAQDLTTARQRGLWGGSVVSGVRTSAQSVSLCYGICGRPSCTGLCAGTASNHNCDACRFPEGAADVSDYYRCEAAASILGLRYTNDLPIDRVHMSHSGH